MKTYSFIGSDKNAGKTTALNFVYQKMEKSGETALLTSIGINGEGTDTFEGDKKPLITVFGGSFFITSCEHLKGFDGMYEIIHLFPATAFGKEYILGRPFFDIDIVLEGPNRGREIIEMKREVKKHLPFTTILIDGSIDRQFLGNPSISDGFYFSLLVTQREKQNLKAACLLNSINIPQVSPEIESMIRNFLKEGLRSLIFNEKMEVVHIGSKIPFMDNKLKEKLRKMKEDKLLIYINGALTKSFYGFLNAIKSITIVIDNFTQYQNINMDRKETITGNIFTLNKAFVKKIFLKEEGNNPFDLPGSIPVQNIYRQAL